ncbi:MAG: zinc-dependent alcohol dehydrogenase family protein [Acidimicrobiia bacterium]|nr:zinc-dependent alcohol dehydrogenase family protein [Acidimicrobiia bacterium]MDH3396558.1 zinc-dependent alcohol dehydrogenase family protein [Acidimicrobiia bacterium]
MQAQLLRHTGPMANAPLQFDEVPDPVPGPGELLLTLSACGVCRTDLQLCEGDLAPRVLPVIPGHQSVGRVSGLGSGVEGWSIDDRAGVGWLAGACGTCNLCRRGLENLCEQARFTGWDRDGGFATKMTVRADFAFSLPAGAGDLEVAPLLCGGVIGYRALKMSGIEPGGSLGLYGFGASALLAIQVALHWGCEVFVVTRSTEERARALEMGAAWAGGYDEAPPVRLQAAVTFAPVGSVVVAALGALEPGGVVAVNAIHLDEIPAFPYENLWGERQIRSVANFTRTDAREFLDLSAQLPIRTVVDPYALSDANQALANVKSGVVNGAAVLEMRPGAGRKSPSEAARLIHG